jgi:hypothetical protein
MDILKNSTKQNEISLVIPRVVNRRHSVVISEPVITGVVDIPLLSHPSGSNPRTMQGCEENWT